MILDFHTHCYPDNLAAAAVGSWKGSGDVVLPDGTLNGLLADLDRAGIGRSVVLHVAHRPHSARDVNDFAAAVQRARPDRLRCFGSIHPDAPDAMEELHRIQELGLSGIKLHPMYQGFEPTAERYFPLYQEMGRLGLPVAFHCGKHKNQPIVFQPAQMAVILPLFQGAPVIGAHLCGLQGELDQLELLASLPVYVDYGLCARYFDPAAAKRVLERLDEDRILFGSDTPWDTARYELNALREMGLPQRKLDKILFENAARLLNWPAQAHAESYSQHT